MPACMPVVVAIVGGTVCVVSIVRTVGFVMLVAGAARPALGKGRGG
jgi:hypothetical protein